MSNKRMNLGTRQLVPLTDVREQVHLDDTGKWDETVSRRDLVMRDGQLVLPTSGEERHLELSRLAGSQFATRLGIPTHYWRVLPNVLKDQNANYWLKAGGGRKDEPNGDGEGEAASKVAKDEKWLLRARYGTLRAVLSESYSPLDNGVLCDTLAPLLDARHRVNWFSLEDEGFHLHVLDPDRVRDVLPGDDYFCGVYIGNSETGTRSVQCEAYLLRLICQNGLVAVQAGQSLMRRRHIHIEQMRFQNALAEAVGRALDAADGFIETLRRTTNEPVHDIELALERLGERWGLSETTQSVARSAIAREAPRVQETAYGLVQGLTEAAQLLPDTARHDLEVLAGQLAQHGVPKWALRREDGDDLNGFVFKRSRSLAVMA